MKNFAVFLFLFITFDLFCSALAAISWTTILKSGFPGPREGHAAAAVGENVYVFGGCNSEGNCFNDLHVYHDTTKSFTKIQPAGDVPNARKGASLTAVRSSIVLFGGGNDVGALNDVYKFDTSTKRWLIGEPVKNVRPEMRSGHAAATDGSGKIYIFGGYNSEGAYLNDLWVLDTDVNMEYIDDDAFPVLFKLVKATGQIPFSTELSTLTYVNDKLYLYGGYGEEGIKQNNLWVFNIKSNEWKRLVTEEAPSPREGHTAIRNGKNIIILGGCDVTPGVNKCYNDIWNFDTQSLKWSLISHGDEKFAAREGHTMTPPTGGRAIVIGGSKGGNSYVFGDVLEVAGFDMCGNTNTPLQCSGHGSCYAFGCNCDSGYGGYDCGEYLTCPNDCHNNGICLKGSCTCFPGYIGPSCFSMVPCPGSGIKGPCNGNGICLSNNLCQCKIGFYGDSCEFGFPVNTSSIIHEVKSSLVNSTENVYAVTQKDTKHFELNPEMSPAALMSKSLSNGNGVYGAPYTMGLGGVESEASAIVTAWPLRLIMATACIAVSIAVLIAIITVNSKRMARA